MKPKSKQLPIGENQHTTTECVGEVRVYNEWVNTRRLCWGLYFKYIDRQTLISIFATAFYIGFLIGLTLEALL